MDLPACSNGTKYSFTNITDSIYQAWRDEMVDLCQFVDPAAAAEEAGILDLAGGRGETRLEAVERGLKEQFRKCYSS